MEYVYPTLLKSVNCQHKIGCFNLNIRNNEEFRKLKKYKRDTINSTYTNTYKVKIYPSKKQKEILKL